MGISVEQYRSRIGSHDNFLKIKDAFFQGSFLEYNAYDVLHECFKFYLYTKIYVKSYDTIMNFPVH